MSKKVFCLVPPRWTLEDYSRHNCVDRSHSHLSRSQLARYESQGRVRWLRRPRDQHDGGILCIPLGVPPAVRGLSCLLGEYLTDAVMTRRSWALTMLAHMRLRRETASENR